MTLKESTDADISVSPSVIRAEKATKLIGYVRGFPKEDRKSLELQKTELLRRGVPVDNIFEDYVPGIQPNLQKALERVEKGDTFVFWRFDVLGVNEFDAIRIIAKLSNEGKNIISMEDNLNIEDKINMNIINSIDRIKQDFDYNREVFKKIEKLKSISRDQIGNAICLIKEGKKLKYVANLLNVKYVTIYNALKRINILEN